MALHIKLKQARKLIGDTQTVAGEKSSIPQSDISYMEIGKRKNIPEEYFFYLFKNGIDLNTLFDETKETATIQKNNEVEIGALKKQLEEKEEMIKLLRDGVELRDHKIASLQKPSMNEKAIL